MKKISIILVLLALTLTACQSSGAIAKAQSTKRIIDVLTPANTDNSNVVEKDNSSTPQANNIVIMVERSGGFAGVNEQWSFYADGKIAKEYLDQSKPNEMLSVDAPRITAQLEALKTAGFFQMKASSDIGKLSNCNDCFTYKLTATSDGITKTITIQEGATGTPDPIQNIINQLIGLAKNQP